MIRFSRKNIKLNVYLAAVMDLYKREVIGYSVSRNIDTELVCRALGNALHRKKKNETPIFHSDRGSLCSSDRYQAMLTQNKRRVEHEQSGISLWGQSDGKILCKSEKEYFYRREYATIQDVEKDVFYYIEVFYKRKRLHSSLGTMSPVAHRMKKMGQRAG